MPTQFNIEHPQYQELKDAARGYIRNLTTGLPDDEKAALVLVDLQNDFTKQLFNTKYGLKSGALYAAQGEKVIFANMALLDTLSEMAQDPDLKGKLDILITMDAHRVNRDMGGAEVAKFRAKFGDEAQEHLDEESSEMRQYNPATGQFGPHCMVGTPGADLADEIYTRLETLQTAGFQLQTFAKINFGVTRGGLTAREPLLKLSAISADQDCFAEGDALKTFPEYVQEKNYSRIAFTGICADVCVIQGACGIKTKMGHLMVQVWTAFTHYLNKDLPAESGIGLAAVKAHSKSAEVTLKDLNDSIICSNDLDDAVFRPALQLNPISGHNLKILLLIAGLATIGAGVGAALVFGYGHDELFGKSITKAASIAITAGMGAGLGLISAGLYGIYRCGANAQLQADRQQVAPRP